MIGENLRYGNFVMDAVTSKLLKVISIKEGKYVDVIDEDGETHENLSCNDGVVLPVPLNETLLSRLGFEGPTTIGGFSMVVKVTYAKAECIEIARNSDKYGLWYVGFRQGNNVDKRMWHENEFVFLNNKLQYLHELQNIIIELSNKLSFQEK